MKRSHGHHQIGDTRVGLPIEAEQHIAFVKAGSGSGRQESRNHAVGFIEIEKWPGDLGTVSKAIDHVAGCANAYADPDEEQDCETAISQSLPLSHGGNINRKRGLLDGVIPVLSRGAAAFL